MYEMESSKIKHVLHVLLAQKKTIFINRSRINDVDVDNE